MELGIQLNTAEGNKSGAQSRKPESAGGESGTKLEYDGATCGTEWLVGKVVTEAQVVEGW